MQSKIELFKVSNLYDLLSTFSSGTNLSYQMSSNDLSVVIISNDYFSINDNYSGLLREAEYNVKNYAYPAEFNHYVIVDSKYF